MPSATHPQAKFDPIPPNLDLRALVESTANFEWVRRVPAAKIARLGPHEFEKLVLVHVILGGKPLVIEKWNDRLPKSVFSVEWLEETYNKKEEGVRDIGSQSDMRMTIGHYLRSMKQLTDQWTPTNYRDERRQRLYLKDIDCPPEWHDRLRRILPPNVFYMNENVDDRGTQRDEDAFNDHASAPAGDLMSCLPEEMRAQNLMCYIGHEGTYTPAHREMCASLGQNIMVEASGDENGEKRGSSLWFMTEMKDREVVKEYFLSMLGHDIEIEKHFAQINAWKKATFPVYVVEQKVGDFILVPPLAPHQVWNRGTRTMKVAWNRTTVETLEMALYEALPKARLVCRDEQYKNKAIIYYALQKYCKDLENMEENDMDFGISLGSGLVRNSVRAQQMMHDFKKLFKLYTEVLVDEMFATKEKDVEYIEFDSCITCSYCRANIFNRFLTCKHCIRTLLNGDEDTYDVCMECYVMGRSCVCTSGLNWCEQWRWADLVDNYEKWRTMVVLNDNYIDINTSPLPLELARKRRGKKSVAQICQEQLRRRPFKDITKAEEPEILEPSDQEVDADGLPVKKKKGGRKKKKGEIYRCHVCCHKDNTYRLAFCSNPGCAEAYCYGTLYRAFDMMPQEVMQSEKWQCPKCLKICNCGQCRRYNICTPYTPKNTLLGHDTRRIADDRSIELLVDFRVHNLSWLKATGEESRSQDSRRMQKLKEQADAEKAKTSQVKDMVGPVLANGEADSALQQSIANGYGDQSNIVGAEAMNGDYSLPVGSTQHEQSGRLPGGQIDAHGEPEDMSFMDSADQSAFADTSVYPDPAGLGGRQLGLAYYQQDDSPDKILFDEYEMPSADALDFEDEQSEFVEKSLRAAKRKAKQENDNDPDFIGPKSTKRSKAADKGRSSSHSMVDPALLLLDADSSAIGGPANENGADAGPSVDPSAQAEGEMAAAPGDDPEVEPHRPALRHAKPMVSYVEPDEAEALEEFNEVILKEPAILGVETRGEATELAANGDTLDLAAEAIRAIAGLTSEDGGGDEPSRYPGGDSLEKTVPNPPRKRGRPGRPRTANRSSLRSATAVDLKPPEPRPRQSRTSLLASQGLDRAANVEDDGHDSEPNSDDVDAQLAAELDKAQRRLAEEDGSEGSPAPQQRTPATGPRKRGRPPKNRGPDSTSRPAPRPQPSPASASSRPIETKFLSMAERMALKGKKFKMGKRKPYGASRGLTSPPAAATPSAAPSRQHATVQIDLVPRGSLVEGEDQGVSRSRPDLAAMRGTAHRRGGPHSAGTAKKPPVVVRLGDTEEDEEEDFIEDDEDVSLTDSDDGDIPRTTYRPRFATRGRGGTIRGGTARGRGRGRGHPPGRPTAVRGGWR